MSKRTKKIVAVQQAVETPVVETPVVETPVVETPVVETAKPKKKLSSQAQRYNAQEHLPDGAVITVLATDKNPKGGKAEGRFALYRDGQTVAEYVAASVKAGNPKALARNDVRWDLVAGFISVQ